ncbi:MAG: alpha/beta hydrolase [Candidatus Limnocylindria bacterium]
MKDATAPGPQAEELSFFSDGFRLAATYRRPDADPIGGVVFLPGSRVTRETPFYAGYVDGLVAGGMAVLLIDYRGWGRSEGATGTLFPLEQVADARNALTYLATRPELAGRGLGLFGVSMGGAHAVYAAGIDERVSAAVAVLSPMDGERMLRQTRREHEWIELQADLAEDRRRRVLTGEGKAVDQLSPPTPERARTTAMAADPTPPIPLACLEAIAEYRPLDVVGRIAPRAMLWFAATQDPVCPIEHSRLAYQRARAPKRLVEIPSAEHYGTYLAHRDLILEESVRWFRAHLRPDRPRMHEAV